MTCSKKMSWQEPTRVEEIRQRHQERPEVGSPWSASWEEVDLLLAHIDTLTAKLAEAERERAHLVEERNALRTPENFDQALVADTIRELRDAMAHAEQENAALRERVAGLEQMVERKNAALARPCIRCGYEPKIIKPAPTPPQPPPREGGEGWMRWPYPVNPDELPDRRKR